MPFCYFLAHLGFKCVPGVFLYTIWPQIYLWAYSHYKSIIHQKIELALLLQRWNTVETLSVQVFYSHWKLTRPIDLEENSIKSCIRESTPPLRFSHSPASLINDTLTEVLYWVCSGLHFSRVPHLEEKAKGDNGQPWHFPQEPCLNMTPGEAVRAADMALSFCSSRTNVANWQALCLRVAGVRPPKEVQPTDPCCGVAPSEHANRNQSGI